MIISIILSTVVSLLLLATTVLLGLKVLSQREELRKPKHYTVAYWVKNQLHSFSFDTDGHSKFMFSGGTAIPPLVWEKSITKDEFLAVAKKGPNKSYSGHTSVLELMKGQLEEYGFDGLSNGACGCHVNDLAPCGEMQLKCSGAYEHVFNKDHWLCYSKNPDIARKDYDKNAK